VGKGIKGPATGRCTKLSLRGIPPPPAVPQTAAKQRNTLGLIALIVSIVGFIFACVPGALIVGWVLLPIAFVLGIVGVCLLGKIKGTSIAAIIVSIVGVVVGVVDFFTVVTDAFGDAFSESDLSAPSPRSSAARDDDGQAEDDTRENPLPIGQPVKNQEWEVTIGAPREAWAEIEAENQFNDPPEAGLENWLVLVTATYTGNDTGSPSFDINVEFVGSDNRTYDERCGVIPTPLDDVGELYKGGVAEGNICVAVPAGADGLWMLSTGFGDPAFFDAG
jgi:hypothetical protein